MPDSGRPWLIVRINALPNAGALQWRTSIGTATLAAAQRIAAALRQNGIRAKVATATDIVELERRLGNSGLNAHHQRWRTTRGEGGWLTTYWYRPSDINAENLAHAWALREDGIVQNITVFGDGSVTATVTVRSAQPPTAPPSVMFRILPGEQARRDRRQPLWTDAQFAGRSPRRARPTVGHSDRTVRCAAGQGRRR